MELIKNLEEYRQLSNQLIKALEEVERLHELIINFKFYFSDVKPTKTDSD
jgi:hypothetical protein